MHNKGINIAKIKNILKKDKIGCENQKIRLQCSKGGTRVVAPKLYIIRSEQK